MSQLTLISLHPNEYSKEFNFYLFRVKLDRCVGSCNNLNGLSNKVCVQNKIEDLAYSISYKTFVGSKPLGIDEIYWFIKIYDGIRYLALFGSGQ